MKLRKLTLLLSIICLIGLNNSFGQRTVPASFNIMENGVNTLSFQKKGQVKLSYLLPSQIQGSTFQIGYSPVNHISFDLGTIFINSEFSDQRGRNKRKGKNLSVSLGLYHVINFKSSTQNEIKNRGHDKSLQFSMNFGYSYGKLRTEIEKAGAIIKYDKWIGQFSMGYQSRFWRLDVFSKVYQLNFISGELSRINLFHELKIEEDILTIISSDGFMMINNKVQLSCGYGFVNAVLGISVERPFEKNEDYDFLKENNPYFGFSIELNELYKKVSQKKR